VVAAAMIDGWSTTPKSSLSQVIPTGPASVVNWLPKKISLRTVLAGHRQITSADQL
jgi:hypothetical protein